MENKYYIYAHINPLKNEIFYIGKGFGNRAYIKLNRSALWKRTVAKYGYIIDIIQDGLTEEEALIKEKIYIARIGRKDLGNGPLVNLTDGGEGTSGLITSEETKQKIAETSKGRIHSEESRKKMSEAKKIISAETRKKLSEAIKGKKRSEETKQKISDTKKGVKFSDEHKKKLTEARRKRP